MGFLILFVILFFWELEFLGGVNILIKLKLIGC